MKLKLLLIFMVSIFSTGIFADYGLMCSVDSLPSDSCLYGTWSGNKESYKKLLEDVGGGLVTVESITGNVSMNFNSQGRGTVNYDQFEIKTSIGGFASVRYLYQGTSTARYTTQEANTKMCSELESSNLVMKAWMTINGVETEIPLTDIPIDTNSLVNYRCSARSFSYYINDGTQDLEWIFER